MGKNLPYATLMACLLALMFAEPARAQKAAPESGSAEKERAAKEGGDAKESEQDGSEGGEEEDKEEKTIQSADILLQQAQVTSAKLDKLRAQRAGLETKRELRQKELNEAVKANEGCSEADENGSNSTRTAEEKAARDALCQALDTSLTSAKNALTSVNDEIAEVQKAIKEAEQKAEEAGKALQASQKPRHNLKDRLFPAREVRCKTAICWGNAYEYGVEPLVDLPIGIAWSVGGGALSSYINSTPLSIEFNAGLRLWLMHDKLSFSVFFAKPVAQSGDSVRLRGSNVQHDVGRIHRPFPSLGIGVLGDMLQIGVAYDVLTNSAGEDGDPSYPPNAVLSRSLTFTLGFATFTAARNLIGLTK